MQKFLPILLTTTLFSGLMSCPVLSMEKDDDQKKPAHPFTYDSDEEEFTPHYATYQSSSSSSYSHTVERNSHQFAPTQNFGNDYSQTDFFATSSRIAQASMSSSSSSNALNDFSRSDYQKMLADSLSQSDGVSKLRSILNNDSFTSLLEDTPAGIKLLDDIKQLELHETIPENSIRLFGDYLFDRSSFVPGNITSYIESIHYIEVMDHDRYYRLIRRRNPFLEYNYRFDFMELPNLTLNIGLATIPQQIILNDGSTIQIDHENVMKSERINRTVESIKAIYALIKDFPIDDELSIIEIKQYLEHLLHGKQLDRYKRSGSEMNEVKNALLALEGEIEGISYAPILGGNIYTTLEDGTKVSIKSLLSKCWWIITHELSETDEELAKHSLVVALGQCIEDDGHRVCDVGKSQRITTALQGYIKNVKIDEIDLTPDPKTFLSAFFVPKQSEINEVMSKDASEQRRYAEKLIEEAEKQAREVFAGQEEKIAEVVNHIKAFINLSFDLDKQDDK